jgi:hypothetical protein
MVNKNYSMEIEIHWEEKYYYQAYPLKDNQEIEKSKENIE